MFWSLRRREWARSVSLPPFLPSDALIELTLTTANAFVGEQSICFQVPACAEEHGVTIVISPLLGTVGNLRSVAIQQSLTYPFTSSPLRSSHAEPFVLRHFLV